MSSARTRPSESRSGTSTLGSAGTPASIRASASSALISCRAGFADVALTGMGPSLVATMARKQVRARRLERGHDIVAGTKRELARRPMRHVRDEREAAVQHDADAPDNRLAPDEAGAKCASCASGEGVSREDGTGKQDREDDKLASGGNIWAKHETTTGYRDSRHSVNRDPEPGRNTTL